jgi:hypothetical protein
MPIQTEFFACPSGDASIYRLPRSAKWNLGLSIVAMHGDQDVPFMSLFMLMLIEAAALFCQPFAKRCAFHATPSE